MENANNYRVTITLRNLVKSQYFNTVITTRIDARRGGGATVALLPTPIPWKGQKIVSRSCFVRKKITVPTWNYVQNYSKR